LLPTKMNLLHKSVVEEALCPICGRVEEDTVHVLWSYAAALDVWGGGASSFHKCAWDGNNFKLLVQHYIWFRRNKWLFEGIFLHPNC
jgi:hypothetical protein